MGCGYMDRLSAANRALVEDPENEVLFSAISILGAALDMGVR